MSRISETASRLPTLRIGMNGNYYVYGTDISLLEDVCKRIGKSPHSIYFSVKHVCWAIRVKKMAHKEGLKIIFLKNR